MGGFQPWPGASTTFRGRTLQVHRAHPDLSGGALASGELSADAGRLLVGCAANTTLELFEVQMEGKRRMPAQDFINGYRPAAGEKLGQ